MGAEEGRDALDAAADSSPSGATAWKECRAFASTSSDTGVPASASRWVNANASPSRVSVVLAYTNVGGKPGATPSTGDTSGSSGEWPWS